MEDYVQYVETQIARWREYISLRRQSDSEISPARINKALAEYQEVQFALIAEEKRVQIELANYILIYQTWWDSRYIGAKKELNPISLAGTKWAAKSEIEAYARHDNADEYMEYEEKKIVLEGKVSLLRRLLDAWKGHLNVLTSLSNNMRSELRALSIMDQANKAGRTPV